MERHILTEHEDIFRPADDPTGMSDEDSPNRIEAMKFESPKKEDYPDRIQGSEFETPEKVVKMDCDSTEEEELENWQNLALVIIDGAKCSKCNFIATDETLLHDHYIQKHIKQDEKQQMSNHSDLNGQRNQKSFLSWNSNSNNPIEKRLKCPKCTLSFKSSYCLEKHLLKIHVEQVCNLCETAFADLKQLNRHFKNVHEKKRFQCPQCESSFRLAYNLKRHQQSHHKSSKFSKKTVPDLETHSEEVQGKTSSSLDAERPSDITISLKRQHQSFHKPQAKVCVLCQITFLDVDKYTRHFTKAHRKKFDCLTCGESFGKKVRLARHQQKFHDPNPQVLPCLPCNLSFTDLYSQMKHNSEMHCKKKFHCTFCPKSYEKRYSLKKHLEKCGSKKSC
jgi:hypothetical protein